MIDTAELQSVHFLKLPCVRLRETKICFQLPEMWMPIPEMAWQVPGLRRMEQHGRREFRPVNGILG